MMRFVAIVVAMLSALLLWGQIGAKQGSGERPAEVSGAKGPPPPATYELTAKTEIKSGIREYAETTYTLTQKWGKTTREMWRILQTDKYAHHWISPSGMVWVLTDSMVGPGGGAQLWARDTTASLRGEWPGGPPSTTPKTMKPSSFELDVSKSMAVTLKNGTEQLRLAGMDGSEWRTTIAPTETGDFLVSRFFPAGDKRVDLLTDLMDKPSSPPRVEWVAPGKAQIAIWTFYNENPNRYLIQTYMPAYNFSTVQRQTFAAERLSTRKPAYVDKTPSGKLIWFEFGQLWEPALAKMDLLDWQGNAIQSVDLIKLGKFATSKDARETLQYRDIRCQDGGAIEPIDTDVRYGPVPLETLTFGDRTGRKYRIDIKAQGERFVVTADASMNLDRIQPKEPTFPGATILDQLQAKSDDGKFEARIKNYESDGKKQSQLTLTINLTDPIEGKKSVELYSMPVVDRPTSIRVSNSGRVYAMNYPDKKLTNNNELAFFQCWDPSGRQMGMDLVRLNWFKNTEEAKAKVDLSKMGIVLNGIRSERTIEGVPIPNYVSEELSFDLGAGRTKKLYIGYMNEQLPTMFYSREPKAMP